MNKYEIKYMLELNKPKEPQVLSNEEAYAFLNQFQAVLGPLNSPRDPKTWTKPVNVGH